MSKHTFVLVMDQEERHALLSNVQMTNWALNFALCGEVSSSLNRIVTNLPGEAKRTRIDSVVSEAGSGVACVAFVA